MAKASMATAAATATAVALMEMASMAMASLAASLGALAKVAAASVPTVARRRLLEPQRVLLMMSLPSHPLRAASLPKARPLTGTPQQRHQQRELQLLAEPPPVPELKSSAAQHLTLVVMSQLPGRQSVQRLGRQATLPPALSNSYCLPEP